MSIRLLLAFIFFFAAYDEGRSATCGVSTTAVNFASYDVFSPAPNDSTGSVTVICDILSIPKVTVQIGPSPSSGGFNPRKMKDPSSGDMLNYNLFTDATRSTVWGDGTQGTTTITKAVPQNKPWVTTVYGRIPAGQNVSAGSYSDTLTVTIIW